MTKVHLMYPQSSTSPEDHGVASDLLAEDSTLNLWEWDIQRDIIDATDYHNNLFLSDKSQFFGPAHMFIERVHPQDREYFQSQLDLARQGQQPSCWSFRLNAKKQLMRLQLQTELEINSEGEPQRLVGILRTTADSPVQLSEISQLEECLQDWSQDTVLNKGNWHEGIKRVCSSVSKLTHVHFVSLWWFSQNQQQLECIERYNNILGSYDSETSEKSGTSLKTVLTQDEANEYFQQLLQHHKLSCNDISQRISLKPLYNCHIGPQNVLAKLDVAVVFKGKTVGVLSLEHQELHQWQSLESALASCAANTISQLWLLQQNNHSQQQLNQQRHQFQTFISMSEEGICKIRFEPSIKTHINNEQQVEQLINNAVFEGINPAGAHLLNLSPEHMTQQPLGFLAASIDLPAVLREWVHIGYQQSGVELYNGKSNGDSHWLSATLTGFVEANRITQLWVSLKDISEEKRHLKTINYQAEHDSLTHLPNRFWLTEELSKQLEKKELFGGTLAVLLIDLNDFREINNSLGHDTGDLLLRQIHPRLTRLLVEEKGTLVRLGGDVFAIYFSDISTQYAEKLAQQCLQLLKLPFLLSGIKLEINASIGVSLYPEHAEDEIKLLRTAEVAMYQAKRSHQGHAIYDRNLDDHCPKRLALLADLSEGIREDQLLLHYQPQIDLNRKMITGYEALVRWNHPVQGVIPPNQFIHLAEMGDLAHPLTLWVLDKALEQWTLWRDNGNEFQIAVNLSTRSLLDSSSPETIIELLKKHQVPTHYLDLEITENSLINNPTRVLKCLNTLHQAGIKLTLDDFGTEYSSLSYLKDLPIDNLKIDQSFVQNMTSDPSDRKIIKAIISLAHSLDLRVIAEGVETRETLSLLEQFDCDIAQGFYLCEPKAAELLPLFYQETAAALDEISTDTLQSELNKTQSE